MEQQVQAINTSVMTPREVDTILARLSEELSSVAHWVEIQKSMLERQENRGFVRLLDYRELVVKRQEFARILAEMRPFEQEYARRRWNRYFLVQQHNGHVHRERNCVTCFPRTQYGWLPELSGCDEVEMVREYGEKACTVCFPEAPTIAKRLGPSRMAEREADRKARVAAQKAEREAKRIAKAATPDGSVWVRSDRWKAETLYALKYEINLDMKYLVANQTKKMGQPWETARLETQLQLLREMAEAVERKTGKPADQVLAEARMKAEREVSKWR